MAFLGTPATPTFVGIYPLQDVYSGIPHTEYVPNISGYTCLRICPNLYLHSLYRMCTQVYSSLLPRPLPDFVLRLWRKFFSHSHKTKSGSGLEMRLGISVTEYLILIPVICFWLAHSCSELLVSFFKSRQNATF